MKNKEIIFYDDTDTCEKYDSAKEFLFETKAEEKGWQTPNDIPSELIWETVYEQNQLDYDDFSAELRHYMDGGYFIITGKCGRWNGTFDAGSFVRNMRELLHGLRHLDSIKFYEINGHFYIEGSHHDGSDSYELKQLTKKGIEYAERNYFAHDKTLHKNIVTCNIYSRLPRFAHVVYGV